MEIIKWCLRVILCYYIYNEFKFFFLVIIFEMCIESFWNEVFKDEISIVFKDLVLIIENEVGLE